MAESGLDESVHRVCGVLNNRDQMMGKLRDCGRENRRLEERKSRWLGSIVRQ